MTKIRITNNSLTFIIIMLMVVGISALSGCKKKDEVTPPPPPPSGTTADKASNYFSITGSTYNDTGLPAAAGAAGQVTVIDSVTGNTSVVSGSANNLRVFYTDPQNDADVAIVGVKGVSGYYTLPIASVSSYLDILVLINDNLNKDEFTVVVAIEDAAGNISIYYEIPVRRVTGISTGDLEVTLSWDQENDLDLHLVEPNGEEIYYGNPTSLNGGDLDMDSNAACYIDGVKVEHITYATGSTIEAGVYTVRVDFWEDCLGTATTNYTVTAKLNNTLVAAISGNNPTVGSFAPNTDDQGGLGDGVTVMTFEVPSTASANKTFVWRFKPIEYKSTK